MVAKMYYGNLIYICDADIALDKIEKNSIQMIYIDPPYNTMSNSFEYSDRRDDWDKFISNLLKKANLVLKESGVIFISIDDNKMVELRQICNEIFGKNNFLGMFITRQATRSNSKHINTIHEYVLCYAKDCKFTPKFEILRTKIPIYKDEIEFLDKNIKMEFKSNGKQSAQILLNKLLKKYENLDEFSWIKNYNIVDDNGEICFGKDLSVPGNPNSLDINEINLHLKPLKTRAWQSKDKFIKLHNENNLIFKNGRPYEKHMLLKSKDNVMSILNFYSRHGKHDLERLGLGDIFSTAKPVEMIKYFIQITCGYDDIVLDFFAGSGTTAQAVIESNLNDNTNRKFILCQIDEIVKNNKSIKILQKNGYGNTIADITLLRLAKLKEKYKFDYEMR